MRFLSSDEESRRRFEAAARSAANLSHANVVLIYDSGEHEGRPFLVMERLPGRTLADEIAEGPLGAERAVEVDADVLAALGAAHAAGIVHGSVKASNVLLSTNGTAKVADFGIGAGQSTTPASDVHSVGVMLSDGLRLADPRRELPQRLVAAVARAVDEDPSRRFSSAAEMARALLEPLPPATAPPTTELPFASPTEPIDVPARSSTNRRPLVLASLAVLAVILLTWITRTGDGDEGPPTAAATTVAPRSLPAGNEPIPAGHYKTSALRPGLQFVLGNGWSTSGAEADDLLALRRPASDGPELSLLAVERVFRADGRYTSSADYIASNSVQPVPRGLVDWLRRHPRLRAAEPASATVGGVGVTMIDVEVVDAYPSQVCAGPCVLLFALAAERPNYRVVKLEQGRRMRLSVFGTGDRTLVISIVGPINGFERSIVEAESVVKSVIPTG